MNLPAAFEQNKAAVLGVAAAGVAGLALWQRRKATAAPAQPGTRIAGTIPAAAVVTPTPTVGGGYDSTSFDLYNSLQPELEAILAQQAQATGGAGGITTAPAPGSSPLFASNDAWLSQAETAWIQQDPHRNVTDLQNALVPWLAGQPVPASGNGGINWAVGNFGAPPQGTAKG